MMSRTLSLKYLCLYSDLQCITIMILLAVASCRESIRRAREEGRERLERPRGIVDTVKREKTEERDSLPVERCDPNGAAGRGHAGHVVPLSGLGVPALHRVQVAPAIVAPHRIHGPLQHCDACRTNTITEKE